MTKKDGPVYDEEEKKEMYDNAGMEPCSGDPLMLAMADRLGAECDHRDMVKKLAKSGEDILKSLTPEKCHLIHMAIGIAGEAGEILDAVKCHVFYNKELDLKNIDEELGDSEFYMEGLRQGVNMDRITTLVNNMNKLLKGSKARYKAGYSDKAAQERSDKQ